MAIKDQCEKCKSYTSCSESKEFNGLSCPSYSKRIDLAKPEDNKTSEKLEENKTEVVSTNVELPDPNQSIQGWLTFFLFSIGLCWNEQESHSYISKKHVVQSPHNGSKDIDYTQ